VEAVACEIRPDVIHAHSPVLVGLPALRVAQRLGTRMIYEVRDLWENACVDRGRFSARSPSYALARSLETYVLRRADAVVTICDSLRHELAPRVGPGGSLHVVANGVDPDSFQPQDASEDVRRRWGLTGREVILYAGTFQPYEGLDLLVRAMRRVLRQRPCAHLVIVGGAAGLAGGSAPLGAEERDLRRIVAENLATAHVTFTGRVPHAHVKELYAVADIVTYPRRWTRTTALTTPLKPLEAMAMAKPIIVSDIPAMRELVTDGVTGLLFRAGDQDALATKCEQLLSDAALRYRLGQSGRDWVVRERQWRSLVSLYTSVYKSLPRGAGESSSAAKVGISLEAVD
jgi:PEP-CTERM/exosortase A-associated glycosyltransferase